MYDPFGEDEEDFNICDLLERHLRAGRVYVSDSENSVEIMDLLYENTVHVNNNDIKESLMSNIQDIKGVFKAFVQ